MRPNLLFRSGPKIHQSWNLANDLHYYQVILYIYKDPPTSKNLRTFRSVPILVPSIFFASEKKYYIAGREEWTRNYLYVLEHLRTTLYKRKVINSSEIISTILKKMDVVHEGRVIQSAHLVTIPGKDERLMTRGIYTTDVLYVRMYMHTEK